MKQHALRLMVCGIVLAVLLLSSLREAAPAGQDRGDHLPVRGVHDRR